MTKILEEVRAISSNAIAKKQDAAKVSLPKLIDQIKAVAALGKTECQFREFEIDEFARNLLIGQGFSVYTSTKTPKYDYKSIYNFQKDPTNIWIVRW